MPWAIDWQFVPCLNQSQVLVIVIFSTCLSQTCSVLHICEIKVSSFSVPNSFCLQWYLLHSSRVFMISCGLKGISMVSLNFGCFIFINNPSIECLEQGRARRKGKNFWEVSLMGSLFLKSCPWRRLWILVSYLADQWVCPVILCCCCILTYLSKAQETRLLDHFLYTQKCNHNKPCWTLDYVP